MKTCLLLLPGLLAAAVALSPPERPGCTTGKSVSDGCNTCTCTEDRIVSCTKNKCPAAPASCQHGRSFLDQCQNTCICNENGEYACKPRGTPGGGVCFGSAQRGEPEKCEEEGEIRVEVYSHFYCMDGIVHFEYVGQPDSCRLGASWQEVCNTCECIVNGRRRCTRKNCNPPEETL